MKWLAILLLMSGCAAGPHCDYKSVEGSCAGSIDAYAGALLLHAPLCSRVTVRLNSGLRDVDVTSKEEFLSTANESAELVSCTQYTRLK